jgi:MFS superfamily sulfate permease-like transporter
MMYAPRSVVTFLIASVVLEGLVRGPAAVAPLGDTRWTLTLVFFIIVAAGLFQALFGLLRLGGLIR